MTEQEIKLQCLILSINQLPNNQMDIQLATARSYYDFIVNEREIDMTPISGTHVQETMKYA